MLVSPSIPLGIAGRQKTSSRPSYNSTTARFQSPGDCMSVENRTPHFFRLVGSTCSPRSGSVRFLISSHKKNPHQVRSEFGLIVSFVKNHLQENTSQAKGEQPGLTIQEDQNRDPKLPCPNQTPPDSRQFCAGMSRPMRRPPPGDRS